MCGRFSLHATSQELADGTLCQRLAGFREERRYNIAPGQWVIVVRPEKGERVPDTAQWGLVPAWAKDPKAGPRPINARAEGLEAKPTFRAAFRHGRCLIPASGFYEWKGVGKSKQPFFIRPQGGKGIFVFAGLLSTWAGPEGELTTCTIITTAPNELMADLHDRMPVILNPEGQAAWLDPENLRAAALLVPCPAADMEAYAVGPAVGNPLNEGPELIKPEGTVDPLDGRLL
ncbi:MAG: SOS response-associated peptidase [Holophagaceae bacterium]|uniref:Abasic site processing protein n=1 Tax=Candidatus Geothrix skivensis TaxID=2954439 RepID=A0A9D7XJH5_9BACT|nr:SOS response-associated peptidase [Candidatus Geothrix skivensis]